MAVEFTLLPRPQKFKSDSGTYTLPEDGRIALAVDDPAGLLFTAHRLQNVLAEYTESYLRVVGGALPAPITLRINDAISNAQGYTLTIDAEGVRITGKDNAGVFYGVATLNQLIQKFGKDLPFVVIEDWPDLPNRGVMLDISRDKVPTMETLYDLIDRLASWKINEFQLYTEHTFAYSNHEIVWAKASPMTAEQILDLDAYCKERFVRLVPNQNSFGHMHRWFEHEPYKHLGEVDEPVTSPWGSILPPFSLAPAEPGSIALMRELFAELLPNFTSPVFNVGCDETFDLGMGKTKQWVETKGKGRVYLDFLLQIYALCNENGRTMQFWGDIINQYPDLVPELPKDTIALEWGYEADHDFAGKSKMFADSGVPFYVCPGTSSWNTIAGRTDNSIENIRNAVENGLKNGAIGMLNTDWGDNGHWQTLPISYLGYAYGAATSWAYEANKDIDLPKVLDAFAFEDKAGVMGKLAYDLGNAYKQPGLMPHNSSILYHFYRMSIKEITESRMYSYATEEQKAILENPSQLGEYLSETLSYIDDVMAPLENSQMEREDDDLIRAEFTLAARMLKHGARNALLQLGDASLEKGAMSEELDQIEADYRELWMTRNRPGGLDDSAARFDKSREFYK